MNNEIILKIQSGESSFELIYNHYFNMIFRFIDQRIESRDTAQDITSETFIKAYKNIHKYKDKGSPFSGWLYRIAYNEVMNHYRKLKKTQFVAINEAILEDFTDEMQWKSIDLKPTLLNEIFASITENEVELLRMRFFDSLSFKEIASVFEANEATIKMKIYRLLDHIRGLEIVSLYIKENHG